MSRGTGETTRQLQACPPGGLFVWGGGRLGYPRELAEKINRQDIRIVACDELEYPERICGLRLPGIVVDHAARLTEVQYQGLLRLIPLVRKGES